MNYTSRLKKRLKTVIGADRKYNKARTKYIKSFAKRQDSLKDLQEQYYAVNEIQEITYDILLEENLVLGEVAEDEHDTETD